MLLQFRLKNYRSIHDEATLNLIASGEKRLAQSNLLPTGLKKLRNAARAVVVYGPNASGKSNLLQGLAFMRSMVAESATSLQLGQVLNVPPFRFDPVASQQPSEFEMSFVVDGVQHQYGFSLTAERVLSEWLRVYRKAKPQQWFRRSFDETTQTPVYEFGSHLRGSRKVWQDATRPNALFLSTAAQLNSELLGPVFSWIVDKILFFGPGMLATSDHTTALLQSKQGRQAVRDFMAASDTGISDIETVPRKATHPSFVSNESGPATMPREDRYLLMPQFVHSNASGSVRFELQDESMGTQRLYQMAAPVLDVLASGKILVVDELDAGLHTLLVRHLVSMFQNPVLNPKGAQLIFSTHNVSLLDPSLLRRDQIWFTEKNREQATSLYPLTDCGPRKTEIWGRGYLTGRYGALPFSKDSAVTSPSEVAPV